MKNIQMIIDCSAYHYNIYFKKCIENKLVAQ